MKHRCPHCGQEMTEPVTKYFVTWAIDIEATSPREAAEKAREAQLRPGSIANVFEVTCANEYGEAVTERIDLMDPVTSSDDDYIRCHEMYYGGEDGEG